ncbi:MAG TPA: mechanosensitive ion channel domain-containing protein [Rhizomicrobium sp.]|nr:mechanosensitive ion channel domain-containing protein [Rhizomicrobium sp.]
MLTGLYLAAAPFVTAATVKNTPANAPGAMRNVVPTLDAILIDNALNLVIAIVILVIGWTLAVWVRRWIRSAFAHLHVLDASLGPILASMARYAILILTVIAVLGRFGVELTSLIAVIGAAGIAVGLALQGTLANVASGLMILLLRPFRAGDMIAVLGTDGTRGTVTEIGLFRTLVTAIDYRSLSIPNSTLFSGTIVNYSREDRFRLDITVPVDMTNDLGKVRRVFLEEVEKDTRILKQPEPVVGVLELGDYAATMVLRIWVAYAQRNPVSWDLREAIHRRMQEEGTAIAVPRQAVAERSEANLAAELTGHVQAQMSAAS